MANLSKDTNARRSRPTFMLTNVIDIKVIRKIGQWVKGRWVESEIPEDITIEGNVQPVKFHEIMQMHESDRTKEWIKIYTTDHLVSAEESAETGNTADVVIYNNLKYKVMKIRSYGMGVLDHTEAYAAREPLSAGE